MIDTYRARLAAAEEQHQLPRRPGDAHRALLLRVDGERLDVRAADLDAGRTYLRADRRAVRFAFLARLWEYGCGIGRATTPARPGRMSSWWTKNSTTFMASSNGLSSAGPLRTRWTRAA
ncbi:hypothetical protein GCM10020218_068190 [Dactylosporangium vinaceum]